jgi:DNA-binding transcriptional regulator YiaG
MKKLRKCWDRLTGKARLKASREMNFKLMAELSQLRREHAELRSQYNFTSKQLLEARERLDLINPELAHFQGLSLQMLIAKLEAKIEILALEQQLGKAWKIARIFDQ